MEELVLKKIKDRIFSLGFDFKFLNLKDEEVLVLLKNTFGIEFGTEEKKYVLAKFDNVLTEQIVEVAEFWKTLFDLDEPLEKYSVIIVNSKLSSEKEIAFKIEFWLKEKNYDLSFYPIVAIDKNSAVPHYDTRGGNNERGKKSSIILIDYGAKYRDYHSDTTRMIFAGKPTNEMINTYNNLLIAQEKTIKQLGFDNNPVSIDQYCRKLISDKGLPIYQHSTGHGVGLQIHEYPKISFTSTDVLLPNQVVTIEPGVYLDGKWGMRIEDTILIKENRQMEVLTEFSKEMLII